MFNIDCWILVAMGISTVNRAYNALYKKDAEKMEESAKKATQELVDSFHADMAAEAKNKIHQWREM